ILEEANRLMSDDTADLPQFLQANVDWHVGVARASHNELLSGLMAALSRAIYAATEDEKFVDVEVRHATIHAHATITDAIREQDAAAAVRRMMRHVHSYAEEVLKGDRQQIDVS
ncbi:MAG TPA: FCD domain-containing protein, partial [Galbitalea sp.]|nr:FCD domain-containing protein [Galbitalea sp.]